MISYFARHLQVLLATVGDVFRTPLSTLMNVMVIGITLALPSIGLSLLESAQTLNATWDSKPKVHIYLAPDLAPEDITLINNELQLAEGVASSTVITKEQALDDFKRISGLDTELQALDSNPLPTTLIATPTDAFSTPAQLQLLQTSLQKIDGIDSVNMNIEWLQRFNAILSILRTLTLTVGALLAIAVVLITSNTVRLLITDRREEIVIAKLVGATNAFVRRPFLYFGVMQGLLGGALACCIHLITHITLNQPVAALAQSYDSSYSLTAPGAVQLLSLLLIGGVLGWLAARLSVARHLHQIKPR